MEGGKLILDIRTIHTAALKSLLEALKELITDANLEFTPEGIFITADDATHAIIVHLALDADKFEVYKCTRPKIVVGLNMINLNKIVKCASASNTTSISMYEQDPNHIYFVFDNTEKCTRDVTEMHTMDIDDLRVKFREAAGAPLCIELESSYLQKLFRDMQAISDKVDICWVDDQLTFTSKGDFCNKRSLITKPAAKAPGNRIVQGLFSLKHLNNFAKCTNLSDKVVLQLDSDKPLFLTYRVASLGEIKVCLAPSTEPGSYD